MLVGALIDEDDKDGYRSNDTENDGASETTPTKFAAMMTPLGYLVSG